MMPRRTRFDPELADEHGLVRVGGTLDPDSLIEAYRSGVFPWYDERLPVCWWSPDPRAILPLDSFHAARRLLRTARSGRFSVTANRAFDAVIRACAVGRDDGTWITAEMIAAYTRLHLLGHAHSVETWHDGELAGGVYGVAIGGLFAAESMFYRVRDASKVALVALVDRLRSRGYSLLDIQMVTPHTQRFGAVEIPRVEYLGRLREAVSLDVRFI